MFNKNKNDQPGDDMSQFEFSNSSPSEDADFDEKISYLLRETLNENFDDSVVVSKWVVVAEVVDSDGPHLVSASADAVSPWDFIGMLKAELSVVEFGYSTAVTVAHMRDSENEDDE